MTWQTQARSLFRGAREAAYEARRWKSMEHHHDEAWFLKCQAEIKECRERAAWYLQQRRFMLDNAEFYWDRDKAA